MKGLLSHVEYIHPGKRLCRICLEVGPKWCPEVVPALSCTYFPSPACLPNTMLKAICKDTCWSLEISAKLFSEVIYQTLGAAAGMRRADYYRPCRPGGSFPWSWSYMRPAASSSTWPNTPTVASASNNSLARTSFTVSTATATPICCKGMS